MTAFIVGREDSPFLLGETMERRNYRDRFKTTKQVETPIEKVKEVEQPKPRIPTETERRQKVCADNNVQWEDSLASLSGAEFDSFINRRLIQRSKLSR